MGKLVLVWDRWVPLRGKRVLVWGKRVALLGRQEPLQ